MELLAHDSLIYQCIISAVDKKLYFDIAWLCKDSFEKFTHVCLNYTWVSRQNNNSSTARLFGREYCLSRVLYCGLFSASKFVTGMHNIYIRSRDATILQYIDILQYSLLQYNTIRLMKNIDILHIAIIILIYCNIFFLPSCKNPIITLKSLKAVKEHKIYAVYRVPSQSKPISKCFPYILILSKLL